jgi:hypothetical protein
VEDAEGLICHSICTTKITIAETLMYILNRAMHPSTMGNSLAITYLNFISTIGIMDCN